MNIKLAARCCLFAYCTVVGTAQAQLRHPDQFYTNGEKVDAWTRDAARGLRSTFWFAKNPADSLSYQQQLVIIYDAEPDKAYFFDPGIKKFVGRFYMKTGLYSLLGRADQQERLKDIDQSKFPRPGALPTVGEMFQDPNGSPTVMKTPPPTKEFPRLSKSSWDTTYTALDHRRIRAKIDFSGNKGTYRLVDSGDIGTLSDVRYRALKDGQLLINGRWSLGNGTGFFRFTVLPENVNAFQGEWGLEDGRTDGTWDGTR